MKDLIILEILDGGNIGHRPSVKGIFVPPVDSMTDMRAEMVGTMMEMGLEMEKHHHEVAPSQNELGGKLMNYFPVPMVCKNINMLFTW